MRLFTILACCILLLSTATLFAQTHVPDPFPGCGTDEHIEYLRARGLMPGQNQKGPVANPLAEMPPPPGIRCDVDGGVPVVVHIIHLGEPIGTGSNISDAQVQQAIDGLNDWWANISGNGTPLGITFQLATRDPNGNTTNGITRTNGSSVAGYTASGLSHNGSMGATEDNIKNLIRWNQTNYYNIWVVHDINGSAAGYAYYPQTNTFPNDGTVLEDDYMTYSSTVLAHELGHAFNLAHTFNGDDTGCPANADCTMDGDGVCDTPPHRQNDCGASNPCPGGGIWNNSRFNIMSYCGGTDRFTAGQRDRVQIALRTTSRQTLVQSSSLVPVNNLREAGILSLVYPTSVVASPTFQAIVNIKNYGTTAIANMGFEVYVDNVLAGQFTINAAIAPNAASNVTLNAVNIAPSTHDLKIKLVSINGLMDETFLADNQICTTVQRLNTLADVCLSFESATLPPEITTADQAFLKIQNVAGVCASQENSCLKVDGSTTTQKTFSFFLPPIDLTGNPNPQLNFDLARAMDYFCNYFATTVIQVSSNNGQTFTEVYNKNDAHTFCSTPPSAAPTALPLNTYGIVPGGPVGSFLPNACAHWRSEAVDLRAFTGQTILIRFDVSYDVENGLNNVLFFDNICIKNCGNSAANLITTEPASTINICTGGSVVLTLGLSTPPAGVSYAWLKSPTPTGVQSNVGSVNNFNTGILPIAPLPDHYYQGIAYKNGCPDTSGLIHIIINPDPVITSHPTTVSFCAGDPRPMSGNFNLGTPSITYQWETSAALTGPWVSVPGATSNTLLPPSTVGNTYYRLAFVSTDPGCPPLVTNPAAARVDPPLTLAQEPQPLMGCVGGFGTLSTMVTGSVPTYRWQRATNPNGPFNPVIGATQSTYSPSFFPAGVSYYRVLLTSPSGYCNDTSAVASVTIVDNHVITVQPVDVSGCASASNALSVTATGGVNPLIYQWQSAPDVFGPYSDVNGANSATYSPGVAGNGQFYRVIITSTGSGCFDVQSNLVSYNIDSPVSISAQPQPLSQCVGGSGTINVTGTGAPLIDYQWQSASSATGPWTTTGFNQDVVIPSSATIGTEFFRVILSSGAALCQDTSDVVSANTVDSPTITAQPLGYSACQTANTPLSVNVTGGASTLNYQWQEASAATGPWTDINGANTNSYSPSVGAGSQFFRVLVTSPGGTCTDAISDPANIVVDQAVSISAEPQSLTQCVGGSQSISATGTGTGLQYQWQSAPAPTGPFSDILATLNNYTPPSTAAGTNYYRLIVRSANGFCRDTSVAATATVVADPTITTQPSGAVGCGVASTNLSVVASGGTGTQSYQWQSGTSATGPFTDINGATAANYDPGAGGGLFYRVIVKASGAGCTDVTSAATSVNTDTPVSIGTEPQNITECVGGTQALSVAASGSGTLRYQWQSAASATGPWSNVGIDQNSHVPPANTAGVTFFRAIVRSPGGFCQDTSAVVSATAVAAPAIVTQAAGYTACQGTSMPLTVAANGGIGTLTYQWQSATVATGPWNNLAGATNSTYTPASTPGSLFYRAVVSSTGNACTDAISNAANVVVDPSVTESSVPQTITQCVGGTQVLNASGTSTGAISYQWQEASSATGPFTNVINTPSTYTPATTNAGTTYYRVILSSANAACKDTSVLLTNTVVADPNITAQPTGSSGCGVANTNLTVTAEGGIGTLTYQWQSATAATGPFSDIGGATSTAYNPGAGGNGLFFRVLVKSSGTGCTDAVSNVTSINSDTPVSVSTEPLPLTQCVGGTQAFTVAGTGTGTLNYQWQSATAATGPWSDVGTNQNNFAPPTSLVGATFYRAIISSPGGFCKDTSAVASATTVDAQTITTQPAGYTTCQGTSNPLTVAATGGIGTLSYQWQSATAASGPWTDLGGATSSTFNPGSSTSAQFFRVLVSSSNPGCPAAISDVASVITAPSVNISAEPQSITQCVGGTQTINVTGSSTGTLQYQWQEASTPGGPFNDLASATQSSFAPPSVTAGLRYYRLVLSSTNGLCKDTSTVATSNVLAGPAIMTQPTDITGCASTASNLSVTATGGVGTLSYQWQSATAAAGPFTDVNGANATTYNPGAAGNGLFYRVVVRSTGSGCADVNSNIANINTDAPVSISAEPQNLTQCVGGTQSLGLTASGTGTLNYQWQSATTAAGPWSNVGTNQATLAPTAATAGNTFYRAVVSSANGFCKDTSASVTSSVVADPLITTQPSNFSGCLSGAVNISVAASGGTGTLTYQWQSATAAAGPWTDVTGATNAAYSVAAMTGTTFYRAIVGASGSGCDAVNSNPANITLDQLMSITAEPQNISQCVGGSGSLSVAATSTGTILYQWQSATNASGPFANVGGATNSLTPPAATAGVSYYRAILSSPNGLCKDTTTVATATVVANQSISTQPADFSACAGGAGAQLTVAASGGVAPLQYQWQSATAAAGPWSNVSGATATNFTPPAGNGTVFYRAVVSSTGLGCAAANSNPASVLIEPAVTILAEPQPLFQCVGGTATLNAAGSGSPNLNYQWQQSDANTGPFVNVGTSQSNFAPMSTNAGILYYRLVLSSPGGLCKDTSTVVAATVADNLSIATQPQGLEGCVGGQLTLNSAASGGIATILQWQSSANATGPWSNIPGATQPNFNPPLLNSGTTYYRMVANSAGSGCVAANSTPAQVLLHPKVDISAQPQNINECVGGNTALNVTATGGTALAYQWQISINNGQSWQNIPGATNTSYVPVSSQNSTRRYRVLVTDANAGCGADSSTVAQVVVNTDFSVKDTVEVCNVANGNSTALLNFNSLVLRGDPNSTWVSLDTVAPAGAWTAKDFTSFTPGRLYRFVATTTNAVAPCINVQDTLVVRVKNCCPTVCTNPPTTAFCNSGGQMLNLNTLPCPGVEAGSWSLTAGPGISSPTPLTSGAFDPNGKAAGAYTLRFTLSRNLPAVCAAVSDEIVNVAKAPEAGTLVVPELAFCDNKDTLMVLANLINGEDANGVWTETSSQVAGPNAFTAATGTLRTNPLTKGTYAFKYTVPAVNGCPADAVTLTVKVASTPGVQAGPDVLLTCDEPEALLGDPNQTQPIGVRYEWVELLNNNTLPGNTSPSLLATAPGLYRLMARDSASGCFATDSVKVTASQNYITDLQTDFTDPRCFGDNNGEITVVDVTGGTPPFRYILNGVAKNSSTFTRLKAGDYTLRVQDRDGCFTERTVSLEEPPLVSFRFSPDTTVFCGEPLLLQAIPDLDPSLITSVEWFNNRIPIDSANNSLNLLVKPEKNIVYDIVLSDKNGCSSTDNIRIKVSEELPLYAPNVFIPEKGGPNGTFKIYGNERVRLVRTFQVFDRGGNMVYEQTNADPNANFGWDGNFRGRPAPSGVYVFYASVEYCTGKVLVTEGSVTLLR